jgi:hypothetical protein
MFRQDPRRNAMTAKKDSLCIFTAYVIVAVFLKTAAATGQFSSSFSSEFLRYLLKMCVLKKYVN